MFIVHSFVLFDAQIHLALNGLLVRIDFLQYLCDGLDELIAGYTGFLVLEFGQQFGGGHWFAHQIPTDGVFGYAAVTVKPKKYLN